MLIPRNLACGYGPKIQHVMSYVNHVICKNNRFKFPTTTSTMIPNSVKIEHGDTMEGFLPLRKNRPQYSLLIMGDKKRQRREKVYIGVVWKEVLRGGQTLNYHNKNNQVFRSGKSSQADPMELIIKVPGLRYEIPILAC